MGKERWKGGLFWSTVYTFLILIPVSIPRTINALRFNSMFGVLCSFYLVICLVIMFFVDKNLVPNITESFDTASYIKISYEGLINGVPYIVFAFMYQPNIPMIYRELNDRNYRRMDKVVVRGSGGVVFIYALATMFGYLCVINNPNSLQILLEKRNILEVDFSNWAFNVAIIGLLFAIFAIAPLCVLPSKDTYEELVYSETGMSNKQNLIVTICMCVGSYGISVTVPGISEAMTILGCTTNPMIGFIFPTVFYLKIFPSAPLYKKLCCWFVLIFIVIV